MGAVLTSFSQKAVEWAKEQGVDIISMSWNVKRVAGPTGNEKEIRQLKKVISDAADEKNILLLGAACDVKGSSPAEEWYPCNSNHVWSIGATDMDQDPKKYVDMDKCVDYLFPGEHVLGSGRDEDVEVGNSGATALAAGLAAAVVSCMRLEGKALPDDRKGWMERIMNKVFSSDLKNKVVRVQGVLQLDEAKKAKLLVQKFESQKDRWR